MVAWVPCSSLTSVSVPPCAGSAGSDRPQLQPWAHQLEGYFAQLPGVGTAVPATRVQGCAARVTIFEEARAELIPGPTSEIEDAFRAYIDALLALYEECPDNLDRARLLHDRANDKGRSFEDLVNRSLHPPEVRQ
jgi:hypothetical protein